MNKDVRIRDCFTTPKGVHEQNFGKHWYTRLNHRSSVPHLETSLLSILVRRSLGSNAVYYPTSIWGSTPDGKAAEFRYTWSCTSTPSYRSVACSWIKHMVNFDRLCGLVVRVSGYRYRGPGFDSQRYQIFWVVVGLERGPLSLVRSIEELLE
jgi:hypothetical protein